MATTLGGVTLADPAYDHDGCIKTVVDLGAMHDLLSGSLGYDYVGDRYHWALRWANITAAQRTTILTRYRVKTTQAFSPPDEAGTYTVLVIPNTWRESYIEGGDGTKYYTIEFELEESAASGVA